MIERNEIMAYTDPDELKPAAPDAGERGAGTGGPS
jgi:hypothetical protein